MADSSRRDRRGCEYEQPDSDMQAWHDANRHLGARCGTLRWIVRSNGSLANAPGMVDVEWSNSDARPPRKLGAKADGADASLLLVGDS